MILYKKRLFLDGYHVIKILFHTSTFSAVIRLRNIKTYICDDGFIFWGFKDYSRYLISMGNLYQRIASTRKVWIAKVVPYTPYK